jgi:cell division protein FtsZ
MAHRGLALMGTGYSTGSTAAYDAAKIAIESPLLDNVSIDGAMGVLVQFDIHPEYPLNGISQAMDIIYDSADENADVIFGTTTNVDIAIDEVKIIIVATGFEDQDSVPELPAKQKEVARETAPESKPQEVKEENKSGINTTTINMNAIRNKMVSGTYNTDNEDILDVPTFLRKQMD